MLQLRAGDSSVVLAPETGGALVGWNFAGQPVLRRALPDAVVQGDVRGLAGFPLLPFCNRIAFGRFHWQGRAYQLESNFGDHPHSIHGVGWQSGWTVEAISDSAATLGLRHDADPRRWPFAFAAELRFVLTPEALDVALRLSNRHHGPAPAGLGLHPYFPRASFHTLRFRADGVWLTDADALPERHVPVPAAWDHGGGRRVGEAALDHCFTGWDGSVRLEGDGLSLAMQAELSFLQVYTPAGQDFFCVEPVSHMPDAINRGERAMRVLAAGESMTAAVRLRLDPARG